MILGKMRFYEISSFDSTDDIHCLIICWIRYQDGFTALHYAAMNGHIEVARLLLDGRADVNSKDEVSDMM